MRFECPNCKKSGQVDDSKVPESGIYATCPQCNNKFLVKRESAKDFEFEPVKPTESIPKHKSQSNTSRLNQKTDETSNSLASRSMTVRYIYAVLACIALFAVYFFIVGVIQRIAGPSMGAIPAILFVWLPLILFLYAAKKTWRSITHSTIAGTSFLKAYQYIIPIVGVIAIVLFYQFSHGQKNVLPVISTPTPQLAIADKLITPSLQDNNKPPADNNGFIIDNEVVTDTRTGLMWGRNGNHGRFPLEMAMQFVKNSNYGGFRDWRLPTKNELDYFVKRGGSNPAEWLNTNGFVEFKPSGYWCVVTGSTAAETVFFGILNSSSLLDSVQGYVWPVREGQ